ncbi:hypothetical protein M427DRAFT_225236 [Gonapodya prolifera JEL478]|uniref:Uncharacterized protein n=1 Tax=Gonapodya prolifera (strain JEL478) TaxID=1344416 RepID=A0A139ANB5_GONPJ|nr:hypothetical protein M427DRAFT_225236 [Gonapodya prolifera JEL478]|eukprot:KXS18240.1 hypothetical protein M427DRAFT_225236 [Gonapodya prolifera JEL478]
MLAVYFWILVLFFFNLHSFPRTSTIPCTPSLTRSPLMKHRYIHINNDPQMDRLLVPKEGELDCLVDLGERLERFVYCSGVIVEQEWNTVHLFRKRSSHKCSVLSPRTVS